MSKLTRRAATRKTVIWFSMRRKAPLTKGNTDQLLTYHTYVEDHADTAVFIIETVQ